MLLFVIKELRPTSCPSASRMWCSPLCQWLPGWTWGRRHSGGWGQPPGHTEPCRWRGGCSRWPAGGRTRPDPGSLAAGGNHSPEWTGSMSAAFWAVAPTRGQLLILWAVLWWAQLPVMACDLWHKSQGGWIYRISVKSFFCDCTRTVVNVFSSILN